MIGVDHPELFWTNEERRGDHGQPYAVRTLLGWSLVGAVSGARHKNSAQVNFVRTDEDMDQEIERLCKMDLIPEASKQDVGLSKEDKLALVKLNESKRFVNGHYQLALPWRPGAPSLNDNRIMVESRLRNLKRQLDKNPSLRQRYAEVIEDYLSKGYAGKLEVETKGFESRWYLPHHAVVHPRKPEKVRVVFDCSANFNGTSLNQQLLQGPDFLNNLVGVLRRFRKERIALVSDVESMFHQVRVDPKDQRFLRFLWWPQGNTNLSPEEYCMKVHLFGATSSPSCANFSLLQTAADNCDSYDPSVINTVRENFYMDDCLKSVDSEEEAVNLVQATYTTTQERRIPSHEVDMQ